MPSLHADTDLQVSAVWEPQIEACLRLHTHVGLLNNSVILGSQVLFLLLMAVGIYKHNSGLRAFNIMYREVRDHHSYVESRVRTNTYFITTGSAVACFRRAAADCCGRKQGIYRSGRLGVDLHLGLSLP